MSRINPDILRAERERKGWSLNKLAKRAGVDPQSIHRIEKGDNESTRDSVIEKLASALGIPEGQLTATTAAPLPDTEPEKPEEKQSKSGLNLDVSDGARNALAFTARRYGVSNAQIVEIAPLLFLWAAEKSLEKRQNRLNDLNLRYEQISSAGEAFQHLHFRAFVNMNAEGTLLAEAESIEARDIFGKLIGGDSYESYLPDNYEESEANPMTIFLKELVSEFGDSTEFEWWYPDSSPHYSICKAEVLEFVGGNEEAAKYIHSGQAPLRKLPKELRDNGKEAERAEWACKQGKQWLDSLLEGVEL